MKNHLLDLWISCAKSRNIQGCCENIAKILQAVIPPLYHNCFILIAHNGVTKLSHLTSKKIRGSLGKFNNTILQLSLFCLLQVCKCHVDQGKMDFRFFLPKTKLLEYVLPLLIYALVKQIFLKLLKIHTSIYSLFSHGANFRFFSGNLCIWKDHQFTCLLDFFPSSFLVKKIFLRNVKQSNNNKGWAIMYCFCIESLKM